jgi:hypothetical protein
MRVNNDEGKGITKEIRWIMVTGCK